MKSWSGSGDMPWNSYKPKIKTVEIKKGITSIGTFAFYRCNILESITIADSVEVINNGVFKYCPNLKSLHLPANLTTIGEENVYQCYSMETISIDPSNEKFMVEDNVLFTKDKKQLVLYPPGNKRTSYSIPEGVKTIGKYAFQSTKYLTDVIFSNTITYVDIGAFQEASALKNVQLSSSVLSFNSLVFQNCESFKSIQFNTSMTEINDYTFYISYITIHPLF